MKRRHSIFVAMGFTAGVIAGSTTASLISPARADPVDWETTAKEPAFRAAVVEVINSCIVENSIIYCN